MTLIQLLNQELTSEMKRQTTLTWLLYLVHVRAAGGQWQEARGAKMLLEEMNNEVRTINYKELLS